MDRAGEKAFKTVTDQPNLPGSVRILDVAGEGYRRAFALFMTGTDEKVVTHNYLKALVDQLPRRTLFVDVGAGDGVTTRHVGQYFECTIAIEPSAPMRQALRAHVPTLSCSTNRSTKSSSMPTLTWPCAHTSCTTFRIPPGWKPRGAIEVGLTLLPATSPAFDECERLRNPAVAG